MLLAVACYSVIPLAIEYAGGSQNPFFFNMGWRAGIAAGFALFLAVVYRQLFFSKKVWATILRRAKRWELLAVIIAYFDIALFAMSIRFVDVSAATIVAEISPLFLIIVMWFSYRKTETYQKPTLKLLFLVSIGLMGFAFVVFSESGETSLFFTSQANWLLLLGISLALASALIAAFNGFSFKWGTDLKTYLPDEVRKNNNDDSINLFGVIMAGLISNLAIIPFSLILGVSFGESISGNVLLFSIIGGALTYPLAGIAWRKANLITHNLGINAIGYVRPILSMAWLLPFSYIDVVRIDYLVIGAAFIISTNVLINFERNFESANIFGLRTLTLALGICGTLVYLREDIFAYFGVGWHWSGAGYFEALALSATVFTLLLAFRVARLVSRTGDEDNRTFSVFRKMELLSQRGVIDDNILCCLLSIDAPKNKADLESAYNKARNYISVARPYNDTERQILNDAEAELDALARSKQLGIVIGEMFALTIFAGITVSLALFSRPNVEGWTRLLIDIFAMLMSAIIIFLVVNVRDLQEERGERKLVSRIKNRDYLVSFSDSHQTLADQFLSVIVGLAIVITYAILLAYKWL